MWDANWLQDQQTFFWYFLVSVRKMSQKLTQLKFPNTALKAASGDIAARQRNSGAKVSGRDRSNEPMETVSKFLIRMMTACVEMVLRFRDGKMVEQRNHDCYPPFGRVDPRGRTRHRGAGSRAKAPGGDLRV